MRNLLVVAALITVPVLGAAPKLLQRGDVALISTLAASCISDPGWPAYGISVIPRDGTVSTFSYPLTWPGYYTLGAIAYSDGVGMLVDSGPYGASLLSVLHDDGSVSVFGAGVIDQHADILGIAPTSTDILVLAQVSLTNH